MISSRLCRARVAGAAIAGLILAAAVPSFAYGSPRVLRGHDDQGQPMVLRVSADHRHVVVGLMFLLRCDGEEESEPYSDAQSVDRVTTGPVRVAPSGRFRIRERRRWRFRDLHGHLTLSVEGSIRRGRRASGTFTAVRRWSTEDYGDGPTRERCQSGPRRWATPDGPVADGPWRPAAPVPLRGHHAGAGALADGRVLIAGGTGALDGPPTRGALLYDPRRDRWRDLPAMHSSRTAPLVVGLAEGRGLVVSSDDPERAVTLRSAEVYDPRRDRWHQTPPLPLPVSEPLGVRLGDGRVAVIEPGEPVQVYDAVHDRWALGPPAPASDAAAVTLLPSGDVLLDAQRSSTSNGAESFAARWHVGDATWTAAPASGIAGGTRLGAALPGGGLVIVGHPYESTRLSTAVYDAASGAWRRFADVDLGIDPWNVAGLASGAALLAGSRGAYRLDVATGTWSLAGTFASVHADGPTLTPVPGGALLAGGGADRWIDAERYVDPPGSRAAGSP